GLYSGASGAGKFESVNEREYRLTAGKIRSVADTFLGGMDVYYAVVPDKSVFAGRYFPGFDPERAAAILAEELPGMTAIDLTSALVGEDFYKTDLHWDQTRLSGVLAALGGAISGAPWRADAWFAEASLNGTETVGEFSGVYPGQLALPMLPDVMRYLADADALQVQYMNPQTGAMEPGAVYDAALFASDDPYSFFLKGPQPLIFLTNPEADTARTLYVFRDSFTSSLEPLIALCGAYREVVLVDLRYIDSRVLSQYVTFKANADALFLYSSQILNNSTILKVN
ncbi:MAG: hypothetical protein LBT36_05440, partial [Oscillospiraceae bacterium]|nr:hypothetical protein [Oscillospiraceae bacterium]